MEKLVRDTVKSLQISSDRIIKIEFDSEVLAELWSDEKTILYKITTLKK